MGYDVALCICQQRNKYTEGKSESETKKHYILHYCSVNSVKTDINN